MRYYANHEHPAVQKVAKRLTGEVDSARSGLERLFHFVRDDIKFGFTRRWNYLAASEVLEAGVGHCTTKATLLHSLCKVAGIPSRVHFALIDTSIMEGFIPRAMMFPMPKRVSHCWTEVGLDGQWRRLDSYIFDIDAFEGCRAALEEKGWEQGFGLSPYVGRLSPEFNIDAEGFVQMGAVSGDHGVWDEPGEFFATGNYATFNAFQMMGFRLLVDSINQKIARLRSIGS